MKLGVNIDHIATLRNARGGFEPSVIDAALVCEKANADGITVHLREDRRHIKDADIFELKKNLSLPINLEMAATDEMVEIASVLKPSSCCIVPERRQELTTEGGLDVIYFENKLKKSIEKLHENNIIVSLFIDAYAEQIEASKRVCADFIELHTGKFANAQNETQLLQQLKKLQEASIFANSLGLKVNAGHGLNYQNVKYMKQVENLVELNIGHSIVSRAVFVGLFEAVCEMKSKIL